jgi:tRNA A22 N-methylase
MKAGQARRDVIVGLVGKGIWPIVDVGADHGLVAAKLGAIATERMPGRRGKAPVTWVIANGLLPFARVGTAIIAGMGARTILGILARGPRPQEVVLHAQDDPPLLRAGLAKTEWRIVAERLAPEAGKYAEVIRAIPGRETATGMTLHYGPRLLADGDPFLAQHLRQRLNHWQRIRQATFTNAPAVSEQALAHISFLQSRL